MAEASFLPSHRLCWFYSGPDPTVLCATHPADQSDLGRSCLRARHLAKPILGLGDVKLCRQLFHAAGCQRGGLSVKRAHGMTWTRRDEMMIVLTSRISQFELVGESIVCEYRPVDTHRWRQVSRTQIRARSHPRAPPAALSCAQFCSEQLHMTVNTDIVSPFTSSWALSLVSGVRRACVKRRITPIYRVIFS